VAVFPGSFDPFTLGHLDVVKKGLKIFGEVTVLVCYNPEKEGWLEPSFRKFLIEKQFNNNSNVKVELHDSLLVSYLEKTDESVVLKGLRNTIDFEFEKIQAIANSKLCPKNETVFVFSEPNLVDCSSSLARQLIELNRIPSEYLSLIIINELKIKGRI
jgi:pantetheine-phosphate adenylyltransferase